jgi:hypothetical protein
MWPSLETASHVSNVANIALVCSLVVGVVATGLIVWATGIKERLWETERQQSGERVAGLESSVAEANARTAAAELELAKLRRPRDIDFEIFKRSMAGIPPGRAEIWYGPGTDSPWLAQRILVAFGVQGWQLADGMARPVKPDDSDLCRHVPALECMGGNSFLVTVVISHPTLADDEKTQRSLMNALGLALGTGMFGGEHPSVPPGTMRIMVGPRS